MKTLDEVIKEELYKGKKLGEMKLACKDWLSIKQCFVPFYKDRFGDWHGLTDEGYSQTTAPFDEGWYPYTEPKKLKKYWRWRVRSYCWLKPDEYLDDIGVDTSGHTRYENWHSLEKIKIEDDYIEVEE